MLLALHAWHPPATVTPFVASLGLLGGPRGLLAVAAAVCWAINRALGVPAPAWASEE